MSPPPRRGYGAGLIALILKSVRGHDYPQCKHGLCESELISPTGDLICDYEGEGLPGLHLRKYCQNPPLPFGVGAIRMIESGIKFHPYYQCGYLSGKPLERF
ncbi:MAG: hypothetical protein RLZ68_2008, partial [Pseudomonadota bacterium]